MVCMAQLTSKARSKLRLSDFAEKKAREYPIEDINHARDALARVSANGTTAEKAQVRAAVHRKYPSIGKS